jgi:hypothetical protein
VGKTVLLALVLLAMIAAAASPASAQGAQAATPEPSAPRGDDGSLYRGAYEVTEDGALVYGGDVEVRCEDLVRLGAPAKPGSEDATVDGSVVEPLTGEAVELCAKAGFPPKGATLDDSASSSASATPSASATASAPDADGGHTLPETGGLALQGLLLAAAATGAAGALLALRVGR